MLYCSIQDWLRANIPRQWGGFERLERLSFRSLWKDGVFDENEVPDVACFGRACLVV